MTTYTNMHRPASVIFRPYPDHSSRAVLSFTDKEGNEFDVFCPADVAEATAEAFNAAMAAHKAKSEVSA